MRFRERGIGPREMQQSEVHHHGVERRDVERQRFGVACAEGDCRMPSARFLDHRRREVEADDLGAACRGRAGDESRTGRDVEKSRAGRRSDGVEQRVGGLHGHGSERVAIVFGRALPARLLEVVERGWIDRRH